MTDESNKSAQAMTRRELEALPGRKWDEDIGPFNSLIILPGRRKTDLHDSGYRCMDFVAVDKDDKAICRLSGCSDVIHINGIGGFGKWDGRIPRLIPPIDWSIDCLEISGLLRMFAAGHQLTCGASLSSFEIYAEKANNKDA